MYLLCVIFLAQIIVHVHVYTGTDDVFSMIIPHMILNVAHDPQYIFWQFSLVGVFGATSYCSCVKLGPVYASSTWHIHECTVLYIVYRSYDSTGESRIGQLRGQVDEVSKLNLCTGLYHAYTWGWSNVEMYMYVYLQLLYTLTSSLDTPYWYMHDVHVHCNLLSKCMCMCTVKTVGYHISTGLGGVCVNNLLAHLITACTCIGTCIPLSAL